MSVTIKDIARIAGVTHSTVSRCLNNKPGASEALRAEIKKIALDLGYEFNANARSLNTSKTGTIGIILEENISENNLHIYTNTFLNQIRSRLEVEDLDTLATFPYNNALKINNVLKLVNRRKVDGLILLNSKIGKDILYTLDKKSIPYIFSHQIPESDSNRINAVYCDHFKGGYLATQHLIEKGCKNILCVTREEQREEFFQRTAGYKAAMKSNDLPLFPHSIVTGGNKLDSGIDVVKRMEGKLGNIDGIFAQTDLLAIGILKELKKRGISIPDDISLIGYDNIELCTYVEPNLSSIIQPSEEISLQTCESLLKLMSGEQISRRIIIPPKLIQRRST